MEAKQLQDWKDRIGSVNWEVADLDELESIIEEIWNDGYEKGTEEKRDWPDEPAFDPCELD